MVAVRIGVTMERIIYTLFWVSFVVICARVISMESRLSAKQVPMESFKKGVWVDETRTKATVFEAVTSHPVSIIQFWASWCTGCGENMVALAEVRAELSSRGLDAPFYTISIDDELALARSYFEKKTKEIREAGSPNAIFDVGQRITKAFSVESIPFVAVIERSGRVLFEKKGHISSTDRKIIADAAFSAAKAIGE